MEIVKPYPPDLQHAVDVLRDEGDQDLRDLGGETI